ncbi:MAG: hypothetical protein MSC31_17175 [Solirubrobacteraceae bacterium MAG38_C4-C5]|nr:hypothetical protein [Candidatus Siliceabacter maunaloa]
MTVEPQRLPAAPVEEVDGELADRPATGGALAQPTVQAAAAVAATSFVAGLATIAAWKARHTRRARRRQRARGLGPIVSSRSFLVDVHVLGQRR